MTEYLAWWTSGGVVGVVAAILVLRYREALTWRTMAVLAAAPVGALYGAKLQFRLRYFPPLEAILIPPSEWLTPGYHIPMGLVGGFFATMLACLILRAPLLQVADALAVTGAAMMPVGRIGCLVSGCCTGTVCPTWMSAVCLRYPPGSEAYYAQIEKGLIAPDAAISLPVHALQIYFGLLGLAITLVHVWLLRRKVRPGTLVAVGFLLYPLGQFGLEYIRSSMPGRETPIMTSVLLGTVAADLTVIALCMAYRMLSRRVVKVAAVTTLAVSLLLSRTAYTQQDTQMSPEQQQRWNEAIIKYYQDSRANRRRVLTLGRNTDELPVMYMMVLADAHLRSGHMREAGEMFQQIIDSQPGQPWAGWAGLGRGWIAIREGNPDDARDYFASAISAPGTTGMLAEFMVALGDAAAGAGATTIETFDRLANRLEAPADLRLTARLGGAYARFWSGDDTGARAAFENVFNESAGGPLADDARYGVAMTHWRTGDKEAAKTILRQLAQTEGSRTGRPPSPQLVNLEPAAFGRGSVQRYKKLPLRAPEERIVDLLDLDGHALARAALRRIEAGAPPPPPVTELPAAPRHKHGDVTQVATATGTADRPATQAPSRAPQPSGRKTPNDTRSPVWIFLVALLGGAVVGWLGWRNQKSGTTRK